MRVRSAFFFMLLGLALVGCLSYTSASYRVMVPEGSSTEKLFTQVDSMVRGLGYQKNYVSLEGVSKLPAQFSYYKSKLAVNVYVVHTKATDNFLDITIYEHRNIFSEEGAKKNDELSQTLVKVFGRDNVTKID